MKAMVFEKHGGPEVLHMADMPYPQPAAQDVLVKVHACAMNHLDIWVRHGLGIKIPMPHILGCEPAGTIAAVGSAVTDLKVGQRVLVAPGLCCGRCKACLDGQDSMCEAGYKLVGFQTQGGYAEFVCVPERNIHPVSDKLSFEEWSAIPLDFLTAWHMLFGRARVQQGETVLVHAAGGGVGSSAIQVAKWAGATVITTASTQQKLDKGAELGADYTINYKQKSFPDEVRRITGGRGVDVIIEHIGPGVWDDSMKCLGRNGRLVTCGATSGPEVKIDLRFLFMRQLSIYGSYMGARRELIRVLELVEQGVFRPVVDRVFPLGEAPAAHQRMHNRENIGKIVLKP